MTLSLRRRVLLTVAPLLLLLLGLGGAGAALLVRLGRQSDAILRENYDSVRAMDRLNEAAERIDSAFQFSLAGKDDDAKKAYRENRAAFLEQLEVEAGNVTIFPDEPRLVEELRERTNRYFSQGDAFFAAPADKRRDAYFGELLPAFREVKRVGKAIHDLNESQMHAAAAEARETARWSLAGFAAGMAASVVASVVASWWLVRTIVGPVAAVTEAAAAIGAGQLHQMVPVHSGDEVGRLAEAFNVMAAKLREYRQGAGERLTRARRAQQATIDSFADPVVVLDTLGRVESANPAAQRVLGVTADGAALREWTPPESLRTAVDNVLRQSRPSVAETFDEAVTFRLDGEDRVYLPQLRPIRSPEGEPLGAAVVLHDVTRFRLLDRLKSDWVATVSHELKTPLTGVRLAVHVLLEEIVGPLEPKQVELLVEARENTERLLKLIEHLLSLARLEDGRERLDVSPTDAVAVLRAAAEDAATRAEDRRISLTVADAGEVPAVEVDAARLGRAIGNLVDNALTYTEPGGVVTLAAAAEGGRVVMTVSDTGIGIPAEYVPHVFERFFRVPGRDATPGTGLGLAIVREIVEAHGGEISCASEVGRGTTFRIVLPAATFPEKHS